MGEQDDGVSVSRDGSSSEERWKPNHSVERKTRFPRACTSRSSSSNRDFPSPVKKSEARKVSAASRKEKEEQLQRGKIVTPLVEPPAASQLPRWSVRSMWEFASLLNFLHIFRPLLNISVEFSAEELETALIIPNSTLDDVHIPLLKAIPPITRMALGRATWVTVLCRKLRDWWHWVAEGEIPIVASHGAEVELYKNLDPTMRVVILKALCDIRVEQEDIRNYIDNSIKHGVQLSAFRRERVGGDSHGVSYWYEDDPIVGYRLYREIRNVEVTKKGKGRGSQVTSTVSCQWETVATNYDEFQEVSDKLLESENRTETSLGKKLKIEYLPDIEKIHKRKERLMKKQHREALLLDSFLAADGISSGRSLRDRKPVTYTFDDFDRSINEAIKITKKSQPSLELQQHYALRRESKPEPQANGQSTGQPDSAGSLSPVSKDHEDTDEEAIDRGNRQRKRSQKYSEDFVEGISENETGNDSDDIMGEAIYDDEYVKNRKQKAASSSEDEYRWDEEEENPDEDEDDDEGEESLSGSDDSGGPPVRRRGRLGRDTRSKRRVARETQPGLRRSKRSTRPRIDYRQYDLSDSEAEPPAAPAANNSEDIENLDRSVNESSEEEEEVRVEGGSPSPEVKEEEKVPRFIDLNEIAPGSGFEDSPGFVTKDHDKDEF
ncbi:DDT domain superfamily [Wolffia australiana]